MLIYGDKIRIATQPGKSVIAHTARKRAAACGLDLLNGHLTVFLDHAVGVPVYGIRNAAVKHCVPEKGLGTVIFL